MLFHRSEFNLVVFRITSQNSVNFLNLWKIHENSLTFIINICNLLVFFVVVEEFLETYRKCGKSQIFAGSRTKTFALGSSRHARGRWIRRACRHRRGQMVRGLPSVRRSQDLVVRTFSPAGLQPQRQRPQQATFTTAATGHDDNDRSRSSSERKSAMIAKASCNSTSCGGAIILDR